jgi:hypothetical protein
MFTDGRNGYLKRSIESFDERVRDRWRDKILFQDSQDRDVCKAAREIAEPYGWTVVEHPTKLGFSGTYAAGWRYVTEELGVDYVFGTEDDFTYERTVNPKWLVDILDSHPEIQQVALRRQPWNDTERSAGSLVSSRLDGYTVRDGFITQRMFFTTNPSVYRASLCGVGWPEVPNSEGILSHQIMNADPDACFAFIGGLHDEPWCWHIGDERVGTGY